MGVDLAIEITLIRHAETVANATGIWQGRSDSDFTEHGMQQLRLLSETRRQGPALVISSPLGRAQRTAAVLGEFETDERWAEMDLGAWDGLTRDEVIAGNPSDAAALDRKDAFTPRRGEPWPDFTERVEAAVEGTMARLGDGERAVVVTHGGVIHVLVAGVLGIDRLDLLRLPRNTSSATIRVDTAGRRTLSVYNDAAHLNGYRPAGRRGVTDVLLFRHGETNGNVSQRWQGRSEGRLTETGRRQAEDLVNVAPSFERLYSSPLTRARDTAAVVAQRRGLEVEVVEELVEMDFGRWENLTAEEAATQDPEMYDQIYRQGRDLARGGTGERFAEAGARVARGLDGLIEEGSTSPIAAVGHGGATRAFVSRVLGMDFADRHRLGSLRNTAMVAVSYLEGRPSLAAYNVAPHLGG